MDILSVQCCSQKLGTLVPSSSSLSFGRDYKGFLVDNIEDVLPTLLNTNATLKGISFTEDNS